MRRVRTPIAGSDTSGAFRRTYLAEDLALGASREGVDVRRRLLHVMVGAMALTLVSSLGSAARADPLCAEVYVKREGMTPLEVVDHCEPTPFPTLFVAGNEETQPGRPYGWPSGWYINVSVVAPPV